MKKNHFLSAGFHCFALYTNAEWVKNSNLSDYVYTNHKVISLIERLISITEQEYFEENITTTKTRKVIKL